MKYNIQSVIKDLEPRFGVAEPKEKKITHFYHALKKAYVPIT